MPPESTPPSDPANLLLFNTLTRMLTDIDDHDCTYWIRSNYFDIQPPTDEATPGRTDTRWYMTPLYIDYDAIWNPAFVEDGMLLDVILKNKLPAEPERIKLDYSQIYSVSRFHFNESPKTEKDTMVYYDSAKMKMPPLTRATDVVD